MTAELQRAWEAMARRAKPRNVEAVAELEEGGAFVVSFVGPTSIAAPHVFVDGGRRYDWRFAALLQACIVVTRGVRAQQLLADVFEATLSYPTLIDFDRKIAASIVAREGGTLKFWPRRRGSEPWRALFD